MPKGGKQPTFFDCGTSRDGSGYKDVTDSTDPEVVAERARFHAILATIPEPKPHPDMENAKVKRKQKKAKKQNADV